MKIEERTKANLIEEILRAIPCISGEYIVTLVHLGDGGRTQERVAFPWPETGGVFYIDLCEAQFNWKEYEVSLLAVSED